MKVIEWLEGFTQAMVGWRKFIVAMTAVVLAWDLCRASQLEGSGFVTVVLGTLGIFGVANVTAKKFIAENGDTDGMRS